MVGPTTIAAEIHEHGVCRGSYPVSSRPRPPTWRCPMRERFHNPAQANHTNVWIVHPHGRLPRLLA
jgi:hypothetical protein